VSEKRLWGQQEFRTAKTAKEYHKGRKENPKGAKKEKACLASFLAPLRLFCAGFAVNGDC